MKGTVRKYVRVQKFSAYFALRTQVLTIYVKVALSVNIQALKYRVSRKKRNTKYDVCTYL